MNSFIFIWCKVPLENLTACFDPNFPFSRRIDKCGAKARFDPNLPCSRSLQTPATHRTINAMHSRVAGERLNLGDSPSRGILATFMNEVLLHLHLQLVSLYTSSDLWLNSLCSHRADFFRDSHMCSTTKRSRRLADFPQEVQAALDSALVGVPLCHLQG